MGNILGSLPQSVYEGQECRNLGLNSKTWKRKCFWLIPWARCSVFPSFHPRLQAGSLLCHPWLIVLDFSSAFEFGQGRHRASKGPQTGKFLFKS